MTHIVSTYGESLFLSQKTDISAEDEGIKPNPNSPSVLLFQKFAPEFDRTMLSIVLLQKILKNDYKSFVAAQKHLPPFLVLTQSSFEAMRLFFFKILTGNDRIEIDGTELRKIKDDLLDALITFMVIHDLGKVKVFQKIVKLVGEDAAEGRGERNIQVTLDVDHDRILIYGIQQSPIVSPSYQRLPQNMRNAIRSGLSANFNAAQFSQGENPVVSLSGISKLDLLSLDLFYLHTILDVAGASGAKNPNGSASMIAPVWTAYEKSYQYLRRMVIDGTSAREIYWLHAEDRAALLGQSLDMNETFDRAAARIMMLSRAGSEEEALEVIEVLKQLPKGPRELLISELDIEGVDDGLLAILPEYAPALIANTRSSLERSGHLDFRKAGLSLALTTLARAFGMTRKAIRKLPGEGLFLSNMNDVAKAAKLEIEGISDSDLIFAFNGDRRESGSIRVKPHVTINEDRFVKVESLRLIEGDDVVIVAIGGGSDGNQGAILAQLLTRQGKNVRGVISVRINQNVDLRNHGGEITENVFRIVPRTTGTVGSTGRFLEAIHAGNVPSRLVIDSLNGKLQEQILSAIRDLGGASTLVAVDTGGDALYTVKSTTSDHSTPDQDLRVLLALSEATNNDPIIERFYSFVIAPGIDTPTYAEEILIEAKARFFTLAQTEIDFVLGQYQAWELDGSNNARFGKTAFAWQAALQGRRGHIGIPLPSSHVTNKRNPWLPFAWVEDVTRGMFIMDGAKHISAITTSYLDF